MADKNENTLAAKSNILMTDKIRIVGVNGVSYQNVISDIAKAIIETYTGTTLDGTAQTLQQAFESVKLSGHPVGSIYMSASPTNPGSLFGGTWEQIEGRFLLSASADYEAGTYGGSADAIIPSHNHSISITSGGQSANHTHGINFNTGGSSPGTNSAGGHSHTHSAGAGYYFLAARGGVSGGDMGAPSGSGRHYVFQNTRSDNNYWSTGNYTASAGSHSHTVNSHTHSVSGNTGNQSANHTHSVSGNTGTNGESVTGKNMPPYLTVYMWERIA